MSRLLIGIVTAGFPQKRNVLRLLCQNLEARRISMLAPIYEALHVLTGVCTTDLMADATPFTALPLIDCTATNAIERLKWATTTNNKNFLTDHLTKTIELHNKQDSAMLFTGHIVSEIQNESEAAFIRARGGLILHLQIANCQLPHPVKPAPNDAIMTLANSEPVPETYVFQFCQNIKKHFLNQAKRAA